MGSNPATPTAEPTPSAPTRRTRHVREEHRATVKSTVENLSPTRVRLAVEVPFDELKPSLDAAYKKIGSQVRVPGFRPGKVPARVIDQRVGRAAVLEEAVNEALPRMYVEAAREHERQARSASPTSRSPSSTTATSRSASPPRSTSAPRSRCPTSTASRSTVDDAEVTDDDVDEQLDALRDRFGTLTGVERAGRRPATSSRSTCVATVDGEEIEGGSAQGLSYEVGSGDLIDGLDEAHRRQVAPATPSTFTDHPAAGRARRRRGRDRRRPSTRSRRRSCPSSTTSSPSWPASSTPSTSCATTCATRLGRVKALEQGAQARDKVARAAASRPSSSRCPSRRCRPRSTTASTRSCTRSATTTRSSSATSRRRARPARSSPPSCARAPRSRCGPSSSSTPSPTQTEVQVGDAELTEYLVRQAARYKMPPQEFANQIMQAGNLPALVADVRRNKALADVLESATITDASGNAVDLSALAPERAGRRLRRRRVGLRRRRRPRRRTITTTTSRLTPSDRRHHALSERGPDSGLVRRRGFVRVDESPPTTEGRSA